MVEKLFEILKLRLNTNFSALTPGSPAWLCECNPNMTFLMKNKSKRKRRQSGFNEINLFINHVYVICLSLLRLP